MILNTDLRQLADLVVAAVPGGVGMPLGVEPSQQEMVALPSSLDNRIKAQLSIHGAAITWTTITPFCRRSRRRR